MKNSSLSLILSARVTNACEERLWAEAAKNSISVLKRTITYLSVLYFKLYNCFHKFIHSVKHTVLYDVLYSREL